VRPIAVLASVGSLLAAACSSGPSPPTASVWDAASTSLALHETGGLQGYDHMFRYQRNTRTLSLDCTRFCLVDGGYVNGVTATEQLSSGDAAQLEAALEALQTTAVEQCVLDGYSYQLTVSRGSRADQTFRDNTGSLLGGTGVDCSPPDAGAAEMVDMNALYNLARLMSSFFGM
jgi:hypothetical protein